MDLNQQLLNLAKERDFDFDACTKLIKAGAVVNTQDDTGRTALHYAVRSGNFELSKFLIKNGAQVDLKNKNGWTSLHCAAFYEHAELLKLILAHTNEINAKDIEQKTPLILALEEGATQVCISLLNSGADTSGAHVVLKSIVHTIRYPECNAAITAWLTAKVARDAVMEDIVSITPSSSIPKFNKS